MGDLDGGAKLDVDANIEGGGKIDIDVDHSHSSDSDDDKKDKKKGGFGFGMPKMPKFHGPHFGGGAKGDIDVEMPDASIDGGAKVGLDGGIHGGGKIDLDAGIDVNTPDLTVKADAPDVDVSAGIGGDVDLDVDAKTGKPKGGLKFGMKMPKLHGPHFGGKGDANLDGGAKLDVDANIEGGGKIDIDVDHSHSSDSDDDKKDKKK